VSSVAPVGVDAPLVSILVVTYQRRDLFGRCFASLVAGTRGLEVEFVVVRNGRRDEPEHRDAERAGATVLRPGFNLGLAGGLHAARGVARGRYLLVVQEDVEVEPGWLPPLLAVFEDDASVGAVSSRVELADGGLQHEGWLVLRDAAVLRAGDAHRPGPRRAVDSAGTASLLVAAEAWDAVCGPDVDLYPLWYVDVDLGLALARAGWNVVVEPRSRVRHRAHSATTEEFREYLSHRNRSRVARRYADVLATRPEREESPAFVAAQLERCAREATVRRAQPRARVPDRAAPPTMAQLVRRARRQAWSVRVGFAGWRVRKRLGRFRRRLRGAISRGR
jgi:O-antigen biosynthesis protein